MNIYELAEMTRQLRQDRRCAGYTIDASADPPPDDLYILRDDAGKDIMDIFRWTGDNMWTAELHYPHNISSGDIRGPTPARAMRAALIRWRKSREREAEITQRYSDDAPAIEIFF